MIQQQSNTLFCPDCGRSWHFMAAEGLKPGDACPSDDCPGNANTPLGVISEVCRQAEGRGISSVGAIAALKAMTHHWKDHLAEGHTPKILSEDIEELINQLQEMRTQIMGAISGR